MILLDRLDDILYRVRNPIRYIGEEWNIIKKKWTTDRIKIVLSFPDVYEIGMSHLGIKILYHLLNKEEDILCERTFAPWIDMEELMRKEKLPLYSLESKHEIKDFDIFGFTLQYEMSYTNILNMLSLADIPIHSKDRNEDYPLVIGGGSTVYNPEPLVPFFDLFFIGEAEDGIVKLLREYRELKKRGINRGDILFELSKIPGIYVPSLYDIKYNERGSVVSINTLKKGVKKKIDRQIISNLDKAFYPVDFIVPYMNIVHDRAMLEIARGCTRGCRFCAAGITYRPVRERKKATIINLADRILESTGYEELSLSSLSVADYSGAEELIKLLARRYENKKINISLPSLRVDRFSVNLADEVQRVRKSGLTFAPEAGTQRLRNVINKGVNENELFEAVKSAFEKGWHHIKLYFMMGLPTESDDDLEALVILVKKVLEIGNEIRKKKNKKMKSINIHVSVSTFIPKPFTPFQWVSMDDRDIIENKQRYLQKELKGRGLDFSWNDPDLSLLEGVFSRGDRRLADVLETAWGKGCKFDSWGENFNSNLWFEAFREHELTLEEYTGSRELDDVLPWEHINMGVNRNFLIDEYKKSFKEQITEDCRFSACTGCDICFNLNSRLELVGADEYDNKV